MKHHLLAVLIAGMGCLYSIPAHAEEDTPVSEKVYFLQVFHTDGSEVKVPFAETPEITYTGNGLRLTSSELEMEYPDGTLSYFTVIMEEAEDGISQIKTNPSGYISMESDGILKYRGGQPGSELTVTTLDGKRIACAILDNEGAASLSIPTDKGTIYLINSGTTTFKLIRK